MTNSFNILRFRSVPFIFHKLLNFVRKKSFHIPHRLFPLSRKCWVRQISTWVKHCFFEPFHVYIFRPPPSCAMSNSLQGISMIVHVNSSCIQRQKSTCTGVCSSPKLLFLMKGKKKLVLTVMLIINSHHWYGINKIFSSYVPYKRGLHLHVHETQHW